jgi:hypothetical protein
MGYHEFLEGSWFMAWTSCELWRDYSVKRTRSDIPGARGSLFVELESVESAECVNEVKEGSLDNKLHEKSRDLFYLAFHLIWATDGDRCNSI